MLFPYLVLGLLVLPTTPCQAHPDHCGHIVCYMKNPQSITHYGFQFDFKQCTHVVVGSAILVQNYIYLGDETHLQYYKTITDQKRLTPHLKVLLNLEGTDDLYDMVIDHPRLTRNFYKNAFSVLRDQNMDGIVINWMERTVDKMNSYFHILEFSRQAKYESRRVNKPRLITAWTLYDYQYQMYKYKTPFYELFAKLDFYIVKALNLRDIRKRGMVHHSPIYPVDPEDQKNVQYIAKRFASLGVPPDRMVISVPLYGNIYNPDISHSGYVGNTQAGSGPRYDAAGGQDFSTFTYGKTGHRGFVAYSEYCNINGYLTRKRIPEQWVTFLIDGDKWMGMDDAASLTRRVEFVRGEGYGGVAIEDIAYDDTTFTCSYNLYPMTKAIYRACRYVPKYFG